MIHFDPSDFNGILKLMDEYGDRKTMYPGTNENGEAVYISIFPDRIVVDTHQINDWTRRNIYHRDGTREELYEK